MKEKVDPVSYSTTAHNSTQRLTCECLLLHRLQASLAQAKSPTQVGQPLLNSALSSQLSAMGLPSNSVIVRTPSGQIGILRHQGDPQAALAQLAQGKAVLASPPAGSGVTVSLNSNTTVSPPTATPGVSVSSSKGGSAVAPNVIQQGRRWNGTI